MEKFCALATARDWQTWLFEYDRDLYAQFIDRLKSSQGCNENRQMMVEFLDVIKDRGDVNQLIEFLKTNYPQFIEGYNPIPESEIERLDAIFSSKIMTFPRRKLIHGPPELLPKLIKDFTSDKINYRFKIADNKAYVEYLNSSEEHLMNQIPSKNWSLGEK